ncbi:MAG: LptF/LptG family permease [Armatimonadota bacterium]|nr:LptF/LptG family permease [bacterium]
MRLLDKLLWRELIGPFLFGVIAFTSVFFAGTYLLKLTNWVMNGMSLLTAIQMLLLYVPYVIVFTLPMSTLLAVLLGLGRLSGDSEVVAMFAGGISLYRIVAPIAALGLLVSVGSIFLNEVVVPSASSRNAELEAAALHQETKAKASFTLLDEGTNSLIAVKGGVDAKTGVLKDVTIVQYMHGRPGIVVYAQRAVWAGMKDNNDRSAWRLYDGYWQLVGGDSPAMSTFSKSQTREIKIDKTPNQLAMFQKKSEQMSFTELSQFVRYLKAHPDRPLKDIAELDVDRWNKLAFPLASLVFALLAAPMGIRPSRSGSSVGFGLSILLIFIYWIIWHYTSSLAVQGNIPPIMGAFMADVLGLAAAVVLLRRAAR